jgi:hypothetical protein
MPSLVSAQAASYFVKKRSDWLVYRTSGEK